LYHYFPEGKEQITEQAIGWTARRLAHSIAENLHLEPGKAGDGLYDFILEVARHVQGSEYCSGGPLQTVALETAASNERLNLACRGAYDQLRQAFEAKLAQAGYTKAGELAIFIIAAVEGGTLLARTYHSAEPLRQVAEQLRAWLNHQV
jgi:TetR/AcrR family transcriptional regulator, lmrAB and yxaGH operons repressor